MKLKSAAGHGLLLLQTQKNKMLSPVYIHTSMMETSLLYTRTADDKIAVCVLTTRWRQSAFTKDLIRICNSSQLQMRKNEKHRKQLKVKFENCFKH